MKHLCIVVIANCYCYYWDFPGGSEVKAAACSAGDPDSIPGSGRSPGKGNGNPLQYSCLENPMEEGAWYTPGARKELDTTERLHFHFQSYSPDLDLMGLLPASTNWL